MTAAATRKAAPRKRTAPRKAATRGQAPLNGNGSAAAPQPASEVFVPPTQPSAAAVSAQEPGVPEHPYGDRPVYVFRPTNGADPIVLPHISTCQPTALFLYDNRNKDQLRQCFAWLDQAGVPDAIGRRIWMLPDEDQAACVAGWFQGLALRQPQGVSPPGEF